MPCFARLPTHIHSREYSRSKITVKKKYDRTKRFFPPGRGVGFHKCWRRWNADRPQPVTVSDSPPSGVPDKVCTGEGGETPGKIITPHPHLRYDVFFFFLLLLRESWPTKATISTMFMFASSSSCFHTPFFSKLFNKGSGLKVFFSVSVDAEKEIFLFRFVLGFFSLLASKQISLSQLFLRRR